MYTAVAMARQHAYGIINVTSDSELSQQLRTAAQLQDALDQLLLLAVYLDDQSDVAFDIPRLMFGLDFFVDFARQVERVPSSLHSVPVMCRATGLSWQVPQCHGEMAGTGAPPCHARCLSTKG